eukprot:TRINITY_DN2308_c0_g1_i2.p1 TRINITY_DN2308_c0_g1~~TRINITY_DN2308_c0_g1_i2.p1  ORF type:complete len:791 (+),score=180.26 TRINITY_DN2308_c0_g1_i2:63-2375(+)
MYARATHSNVGAFAGDGRSSRLKYKAGDVVELLQYDATAAFWMARLGDLAVVVEGQEIEDNMYARATHSNVGAFAGDGRSSRLKYKAGDVVELLQYDATAAFWMARLGDDSGVVEAKNFELCFLVPASSVPLSPSGASSPSIDLTPDVSPTSSSAPTENLRKSRHNVGNAPARGLPAPKKSLPSAPSSPVATQEDNLPSEVKASADSPDEVQPRGSDASRISSPNRKLPALPPSKANSIASTPKSTEHLNASMGRIHSDELLGPSENRTTRTPSAPDASSCNVSNFPEIPTRALPVSPRKSQPQIEEVSASHLSPKAEQTGIQLTDDDRDDNIDEVAPLPERKKSPPKKKLTNYASDEGSDDEFAHVSVAKALNLQGKSNLPTKHALPELDDDPEVRSRQLTKMPPRLFIAEIKSRGQESPDEQSVQRPKSPDPEDDPETRSKNYKLLPQRQFISEIKSLYRHKSSPEEEKLEDTHELNERISAPSAPRVKAFENWRPSLLKKQLAGGQSAGLSAEDFAKLVSGSAQKSAPESGGDMAGHLRRGAGPTLHKRDHSTSKLKLLHDQEGQFQPGVRTAAHGRMKSREIKPNHHNRQKSGASVNGDSPGSSQDLSSSLTSPGSPFLQSPTGTDAMPSRRSSRGFVGDENLDNGDAFSAPALTQSPLKHSRQKSNVDSDNAVEQPSLPATVTGFRKHSRQKSNQSGNRRQSRDEDELSKPKTPATRRVSGNVEDFMSSPPSSPNEDAARMPKARKPPSALKKMIRKMDDDSDMD